MPAECQLVDRSQPFGPADFPLPDYDLAGLADTAELIVGGGCFWCTEAVFTRLEGVTGVTSGYAGGDQATANYREVCGGATGHAEVIKIAFEPSKITYGQLLKVFFSVAHDPTQLNRQGNDRGTQYRSAIFYANQAQRELSEKYIQQLNDSGLFASAIETTLEPLEVFYPAEAYHQDYAALNPNQAYIQGVSMPKVEKLNRYFPENLK